MSKHAYLIIAHNNFEQLQQLVNLLDDDRNDIYLHIDKKAKSFTKDTIKTKYSKLFLTDRVSVKWGGHSQIESELILLKAATKNHYNYYHLISGVDLPLKSQDHIHEFFEKNDGKEFIEYDPVANENKLFYERTQYYYFCANIYGRTSNPIYLPLKLFEWVSLKLQKIFKFRRKEIIPLYKGANWVSITDKLANYVVENEDIIRKQFYYSFCADEVFLQSIAMASPYKENIVNDYLRAIDWERGMPYIYRKEDVSDLLSSRYLWGRKFDSGIDQAAIDEIYNKLVKK